MTRHPVPVRRVGAASAALVLLAFGSSCHGTATDALLHATDPDVISPENVNSADGATALRNGALNRLRTITAGTGGEGSTWLAGGLVADEWTTSSTFIQNDQEDERKAPPDNGTITGMFRNLNQARTSANQAIAAMKVYLPTQTANIAELYFVRGFAELQLAMDYCNGIPLSDGSGTDLVLGQPLTDDQVFAVASASFDTVITMTASLTDAFGVSINRAGRLGKARALMNRNDYAGAAALVTAIPSTYAYTVTYATTSGDNTLWSQPNSSRRYSVGDTVVTTSGGKFSVKPSIPFGSAKDPRLPVVNSPAGTKSQDGSVISYTTSRYARSTTTSVVNGIDARFIEAENDLKLGNTASWLAALNELRSAPPLIGTLQLTSAQLPPLADPGTDAARVDLTFYEKAFWTFSRGQRLSDVRRLIRQYGRDESTLLPQGQHYRGVPYGDDVNLQVPQAETANPNFQGCMDRKA